MYTVREVRKTTSTNYLPGGAEFHTIAVAWHYALGWWHETGKHCDVLDQNGDLVISTDSNDPSKIVH